MKRVRISIWIVIVILLFALVAAVLVDRVTGHMLYCLSQAENKISDGDYPALNGILTAMEQYYAVWDSWLMLLVRRDFVMNPQCSFSVLSAYAQPDNDADFKTELLRARTQLLQLRALFFAFV